MWSIPNGMPATLLVVYALILVTLGVITFQFSGSVMI